MLALSVSHTSMVSTSGSGVWIGFCTDLYTRYHDRDCHRRPLSTNSHQSTSLPHSRLRPPDTVSPYSPLLSSSGHCSRIYRTESPDSFKPTTYSLQFLNSRLNNVAHLATRPPLCPETVRTIRRHRQWRCDDSCHSLTSCATAYSLQLTAYSNNTTFLLAPHYRRYRQSHHSTHSQQKEILTNHRLPSRHHHRTTNSDNTTQHFTSTIKI